MRACIVTGSRSWRDAEMVYRAVDQFNPDVIIHGACPSGADEYAGRCYAQAAVVPMPAQWKRDGKAAGPKRNRAMLDVLLTLQSCGYEIAVLAFPMAESRGTRDMMAQAREAGVRVVEA
jgi:hypothetical protein